MPCLVRARRRKDIHASRVLGGLVRSFVWRGPAVGRALRAAGKWRSSHAVCDEKHGAEAWGSLAILESMVSGLAVSKIDQGKTSVSSYGGVHRLLGRVRRWLNE